MANQIQIKRGNKEITPTLSSGEIAINYYDGNFYVGSENNSNLKFYNSKIIDELLKRIELREVSVELFGAKGDYDENTDTGTDDTLSIQKAIDYAYENKINVVSFGSKGYVITSPINIKSGITLKGTKELINQGKATDVNNGSNRYRKIENTSFIMKPNTISDTLLNFERNSGIMNLSIIYYQNYASSNVIQYGDCIVSTHGFHINNVLFSGCYNFINARGEGVQIHNLYGYSCGTGIYLHNSADVCHISNIHFNPNVTRPTTSFTNGRKSDVNSIALKLEDCDGVNITDFFCIGYRTGVQGIGFSGALQNTFNLSNFFMDWVGCGFDLDQDSGWAININNGVVVCGFSDDSNHCGFMKLNKSNGNTIFQPVNMSNISVSTLVEYIGITGVKPNYLFNFVYPYGWVMGVNNLTYDSGNLLIGHANSNNAYWSGTIRSANTYRDLEFISTPRNLVENPQLDQISDGLPSKWVKTTSSHTINCVKNKYGNTEINFLASETRDWLGLRNTVTITESATMSIQGKFKMTNTSSGARLFITFEDGKETYLTPDKDGYIRGTISGHNKFYITITPGTGGDRVEVEYVTLQSGDGNRPIRF